MFAFLHANFEQTLEASVMLNFLKKQLEYIQYQQHYKSKVIYFVHMKICNRTATCFLSQKGHNDMSHKQCPTYTQPRHCFGGHCTKNSGFCCAGVCIVGIETVCCTSETRSHTKGVHALQALPANLRDTSQTMKIFLLFLWTGCLMAHRMGDTCGILWNITEYQRTLQAGVVQSILIFLKC